MAKTKDYLPRTDALRLAWYENFYMKLILLYVLTFELTTAQTDALLADLKALRYTNLLCDAITKGALACNGYKKSMTGGKNVVATPGFPQIAIPLLPPTAVQPGIFNRIRKFVKILKAHANYNADVIGKNLATEGETIVPDYATMRPNLKLSMSGLATLVKYTKKGTDSIHLYCKRGAETEFTFLATISKASWNDMRANLVAGLPETRNYQAWYVMGDQVIGLISAVQTINVG